MRQLEQLAVLFVCRLIESFILLIYTTCITYDTITE